MPDVLLKRLKIDKAKILVVDDEPINTEILASALEQDYLVKVVHSGEDAMSALTRFVPDLILLDIRMPQMDGYDVLRLVKSTPQFADIPVIFVTGENSTNDELKGLQLGAVDYVRKPFRMPLVLARVALHIDLKRKNDILESLASLDGLTGIYNRRKFDECLETFCQTALRYSKPLGLVILDIDYFKQYNDFYGHSQGDDCLKKVAGGIATVAKRATDVVARVGGEEFALLLPNVDKIQLQTVVDALQVTISELAIPHENSQIAEKVTVSIGATSLTPNLQSDKDYLYSRADELLYEAKEKGRSTSRID